MQMGGTSLAKVPSKTSRVLDRFVLRVFGRLRRDDVLAIPEPLLVKATKGELLVAARPSSQKGEAEPRDMEGGVEDLAGDRQHPNVTYFEGGNTGFRTIARG